MMSATTAESGTSQRSSHALPQGQILRTLRATGVSGVAATVANVVLLLVAGAVAGRDIVVDQNGAEQIIGVSMVIVSMVVATLLASVAALVSARVFRNGRTVFMWGAIALAVLTLHPFLLAVDTFSGSVLYAMHLVAGAIMIPVILRSLPSRVEKHATR